MKVNQKLAATALAAGLAVAGMTATAPSAAAVGGCPSGQLCLYEDPLYHDMDVQTGTTKVCVDLSKHGDDYFRSGIGSYVNNLPVKAVVYRYNRLTKLLVYDGTIRAGGFSSDTGGGFGYLGMVCTGGAIPPY
ncbi:peptidase inhibitor family I36 protein [Streptomyces sp. NPDC054787]